MTMCCLGKPSISAIFSQITNKANYCYNIKQGTSINPACSLLFLCPTFEVPFPAFYADNLSTALPFLQAADRDSPFSRKRFLTHTKGFPVCPDANSLSIIRETIEFIQEICHRNSVELCQTIHLLRFNMLREPFFDGLVDTVGHPHFVCHFHLHKPTAVSAPAEPVRYIVDLLISSISLIELGRLQNLPRGAQYKTMYV